MDKIMTDARTLVSHMTNSELITWDKIFSEQLTDYAEVGHALALAVSVELLNRRIRAVALTQVKMWKTAGLYSSDMYRRALASAETKIYSVYGFAAERPHHRFRRHLLNVSYLAPYGLAFPDTGWHTENEDASVRL